MECLELPSYSIWIRPQGTGATTTDIILESKTMLPKAVMRRSEIVPKVKKRITPQEEKESTYHIMKSFDQLLPEEQDTTEELKV